MMPVLGTSLQGTQSAQTRKMTHRLAVETANSEGGYTLASSGGLFLVDQPSGTKQ